MVNIFKQNKLKTFTQSHMSRSHEKTESGVNFTIKNF